MIKNISPTKQDKLFKYGFNACALLTAVLYVGSPKGDFDSDIQEMKKDPVNYCQDLVKRKSGDIPADSTLTSENYVTKCVDSVENMPNNSHMRRQFAKTFMMASGSTSIFLFSIWGGLRRKYPELSSQSGYEPE